jgi:hypothetical protein
MVGGAPAIDERFVEAAAKGRPAETRFRFAGLCHQSACHQWQHGRCSVIGQVLESSPEPQTGTGAEREPTLPDCAIRTSCRWYAQEGGRACAVCPGVVTDDGSGPPVWAAPKEPAPS